MGRQVNWIANLIAPFDDVVSNVVACVVHHEVDAVLGWLGHHAFLQFMFSGRVCYYSCQDNTGVDASKAKVCVL